MAGRSSAVSSETSVLTWMGSLPGRRADGVEPSSRSNLRRRGWLRGGQRRNRRARGKRVDAVGLELFKDFDGEFDGRGGMMETVRPSGGLRR